MPNSDQPISLQGIDSVKLRYVLRNVFNLPELKLLCDDLKINFADVERGQITETVLELIGYFERRNRTSELVDYILAKRPHISQNDLRVDSGPPTPGLPVNFEFVNRAYELDLICKPGAPRFILIDGAAGYGKTYLLHKIKKSYESKERETWKGAYIDLKQDQEIRSEDLGIVQPRIANAIVQQFRLSSPDIPSFPFGTDEKDIINKLVGFLNRQKADILLLLDNIEVLPRHTSSWLQDLVYKLDQGLQKGQHKLHVVFSGRYASDWGRGTPYPVTTIALSSFDRVAVREMVDRRAKNLGQQPTQGYLEELTWQILYLSGGHPQGICKVLDKITEEVFIAFDSEWAIFGQQFQDNGRHGTLFTLAIEPIIQTLVSDLKQPLSEVFKRLSPIRRFNEEILDHFLEEKLITIHSDQSTWDLIRAMLRTHLISPPTRSDPMFSDQIVRRMMAMQLQLNDPALFQTMNEQAGQLFHERACKREQADPEVWRVAVIESLYHTLQLGVREESIRIRETLIERVKTYLAQTNDLRDLHQLKDALWQDVELKDLINRRTGDKTMQTLLGLIEDRIGI